jgi:hypothetical protein
MAHFAELDESNIVIRVIVVNNDKLTINGIENEQKGIEFCQKLFGGKWVQTSYNNNFRYNFAGIGFEYNEKYDAFIPPKPSDKCILNTNTFQWITLIEK